MVLSLFFLHHSHKHSIILTIYTISGVTFQDWEIAAFLSLLIFYFCNYWHSLCMMRVQDEEFGLILGIHLQRRRLQTVHQERCLLEIWFHKNMTSWYNKAYENISFLGSSEDWVALWYSAHLMILAHSSFLVRELAASSLVTPSRAICSIVI